MFNARHTKSHSPHALSRPRTLNRRRETPSGAGSSISKIRPRRSRWYRPRSTSSCSIDATASTGSPRVPPTSTPTRYPVRDFFLSICFFLHYRDVNVEILRRRNHGRKRSVSGFNATPAHPGALPSGKTPSLPATVTSPANASRHLSCPETPPRRTPSDARSAAIRRKCSRLHPVGCSPPRDRALMTRSGCRLAARSRKVGGGLAEEDRGERDRIKPPLRRRAFPPRHSADLSGADSDDRNRPHHCCP